jgi:hypothetical protein
MNRKLIHVAERREHLIAQAAAQRGALVRDIEPWRIPLALTDQGLNALRYIKNHPKWIIGGITLLSILQPRNAGKWLGRGWVTWQLMNRLRVRSEESVMSPKIDAAH